MSHSTTYRRLVLALLTVFFLIIPVSAEDKPDAEEAEKLLKATQNPVASLISVPVQNNTNFNLGPADRTQDILNIQPVIPVGLSKDWNLIVRWITRVVWQPVP